MKQPDFEKAKNYALGRLARETPPYHTYHSLAHTRDDVLPAAVELGRLEGVEGLSMTLLQTAALYHDIGFLEKRNGHEEIGARLAAAILPEFGYQPAQIQAIRGMILATRLPQSPTNRLEEIMADADLDSLGREDFFARSLALREEMEALGMRYSDQEWYRTQLEFLQRHRYFTISARNLRAIQKQQNIDLLLKMLA